MNTHKISIVENIVGTLTISMKKLFDKGEIDQLYSKIYEAADKIAVFETQRYHTIKSQELQQKLEIYESDTSGEGPDILGYFKRDENYRMRRLNFHLNQMCRLLELYVQSKSKGIS